MRTGRPWRVGAVVLAAVLWAAGIGGAWGSPAPAVVKGFVGGEKLGFFQDPQVTDLLAREYGLVLRVLPSGSLEMGGRPGKVDFLFPASGWAAERGALGSSGAPTPEALFWTPLVVYSWKPVAQVLTERKVTVTREGVLWLEDLKTLVDWVVRGTRWAELGLPALPGRVVVLATDPTRSHSGLGYAVLAASALRGGQAPDRGSLEGLLPSLRSLFARQGVLLGGSKDLFDEWARTGMEVSPLAVGYENQIVELVRTRPEAFARIRDSLAVLYPDPPLWSAHAFVALSGPGRRLQEALRDPRLRRLAWERHGLRSDPQEPSLEIPGLSGLASRFPRPLPLPDGVVLEALTRGLAGTTPKVP